MYNFAFVTLTPDMEFVVIEENPPAAPQPKEPAESQMSEEEKKFKETWIGKGELEREHGIIVIHSANSATDVHILFGRENDGFEKLYTIYGVPSKLNEYEELDNNGIRYMYRGNQLYFNREDLRNIGIIP